MKITYGLFLVRIKTKTCLFSESSRSESKLPDSSQNKKIEIEKQGIIKVISSEQYIVTIIYSVQKQS